ncbi:hypothetical protein QC764_000190 [Podospora pseudoanserina]|uniref:Glucose-methanol-choline oxidoreductase N-terminal domain-containing protein n=1 Tax=Podospora pseudoanserina TaxID=2609844 RepID=A0ABR0I4H6_9PEZI|nr:hypothetical protein QC764_000190 [Podospora pseudoanserina]
MRPHEKVLVFLQISCCFAIAATRAEVFDYVIVGGGTAGLVVANRLSETPTVRVAVIEAGGDERNNPNVTLASGYITMAAYNTPIDWAYQTVPQPGVNNTPLTYHQGKAIGGTSAINGMAYVRSNQADLDAWERLGNPGWNWASLYPYSMGAENFTFPGPGLQASGVTFDAAVHGYSGPIHTGYGSALGNMTLMPAVQDAWEELGLLPNVDTGRGKNRGVSANPLTLEPGLPSIRCDSARAYWYPVEDRPNLKIIKGTARRLVWRKNNKPCSKKANTATGVEYLDEDGQAVVLSATKEVILSAGSLRTPLVLESSGVGNQGILKRLGIPVVVSLPGVGENFQDQGNNIVFYNTTANATGAVVSQTWASPADVFGSDLADIANSTRNELPRWADLIVSASGDAGALLNRSAVEAVLRAQHDLVFGDSEGATTLVEFVTTAFGNGMLMSQHWTLFPFSRGSVHLASADVSKINEPRIDPRFNLVDFDITAQTQAAKLAARLGKTDALGPLVSERIRPSLDILPENATDAQWREFIKTTLDVDHHIVGTAAMMSRDLGGVVDPELRVYGTANVRVVDMSVIPLHFSGHPVATLYAVAERAADIIRRSPLYAA